MHSYVRNAGIAVLIGLTIAWMVAFIAMAFRPNQGVLSFVALGGGAVLIVMVLRLLIHRD